MDNDSTNGAEGSQNAESAGRKCPACGAENQPDAESCSECGQRFLPAQVHYRSVGEALGVQPEEEASARPSEGPRGSDRAEGAAKHGALLGEELQRIAEQKRAEGQQRKEEQQRAEPQEAGSEFRYIFTPQSVEAQTRRAGLGRRALAVLLDWVAVYLVFTVMLYFIGAETVVAEAERVLMEQGFTAFADPEALPASLGQAAWVLTALMWALLIGLSAAFTTYGGSTPGKALTGIRVTMFDGSEVGWWPALLRSAFLWVFTYLTVGLYLVFAALYCLIDPYGRSIHDIVAGTRVVRGR